jgi:hypothetical protein
MMVALHRVIANGAIVGDGGWLLRLGCKPAAETTEPLLPSPGPNPGDRGFLFLPRTALWLFAVAKMIH